MFILKTGPVDPLMRTPDTLHHDMSPGFLGAPLLEQLMFLVGALNDEAWV